MLVLSESNGNSWCTLISRLYPTNYVLLLSCFSLRDFSLLHAGTKSRPCLRFPEKWLAPN